MPQTGTTDSQKKPEAISHVYSESRIGGFFDSLTRFLVAILPFVLGAGLIAVRLPPWFDEMAKLWGPGFIILGIFVLGFIRYVPPGALRDLIKAQQQQAEAMRTMVRSIENIEQQLTELLKTGGPLSVMKDQLNHIDWRLGFVLQGVRPPQDSSPS